MFEVNKDRDIDDAVEELFLYYRKTGFPNYELSQYDYKKELSNIKKYPTDKTIDHKNLRHTMPGCGFLWTFFPHWIDITYKNQNKSIRELWEDDEKLKTLIRKTYIWQLKYGNGFFTENRIRQNAKVYLSKQSVSNFRPTAAKYIYNTYGNKGSVYDMSAGFGGRLLGFLASGCNSYIGVDPSYKTYKGLTEIKNSLA